MLTTFLSSCDKGNAEDRIDVSKQWTIDNVGQISGTPIDDQWHSKSFTPKEMSLFNSLDTVDLSGTTKPDNVFEPSGNYFFPNPFDYSQLSPPFHFNNNFSGDVVFKVIYTDNLLKPLFKASIKLHATTIPSTGASYSGTVAFLPTFPVGMFRVYYTLSAIDNPHFYKSWGNVQKVQF